MSAALHPPWRPHDLLFARARDGFTAAGARLDWLDDGDWAARAPLVVRRALVDPGVGTGTHGGRIPVGARGALRNQRCAGYLAADAVARRVTPERLAAAVIDAPALDLRAAADRLPAIAALLALAPRLQALVRDWGLAWGPAGGAGFWLASGLPVLRPDSDLDLLVRAPQPPAASVVEALAALQDGAACRIDIQIDTGHGGFAFNEYVRETRRGGRVMLKTAAGPLLVADPWQVRAAA
jgi:phosphoribosyl-dephospho-CoA transferase